MNLMSVVMPISFHPIADVLPLIDGAEFAALVASIKDHGLRDPIITFEDMILDGRNRYRACLQAGVQPRFETFCGADPVAFVADKNIHRRQLTSGQKAMAVIEYATLSRGQRQSTKPDAGKPAFRRQRDIAKLIGVNKETVSDARTIKINGTAEEIARVTGGAPISRIARAVRARRDGGPDYGCRVRVSPTGKSVTECVRDGIELMRGGTKIHAAQQRSGVSRDVFRHVRDLILLSERDDIDAAERTALQAALREIDETRRVKEPWRNVKSIVDRHWTPGDVRLKGGGRINRRVKQFENAITFLQHTCENAVTTINPPSLSREQAATAIRQLKEAKTSLDKLVRQIWRAQE